MDVLVDTSVWISFFKVIRNGLPVFSLDGHFRQMAKKLPLKLWPA